MINVTVLRASYTTRTSSFVIQSSVSAYFHGCPHPRTSIRVSISVVIIISILSTAGHYPPRAHVPLAWNLSGTGPSSPSRNIHETTRMVCRDRVVQLRRVIGHRDPNCVINGRGWDATSIIAPSSEWSRWNFGENLRLLWILIPPAGVNALPDRCKWRWHGRFIKQFFSGFGHLQGGENWYRFHFGLISTIYSWRWVDSVDGWHGWFHVKID